MSNGRDILHVLGTLDRGGIETWLVRLLHASPELAQRSRICLTAVPPENPGVHANQVRALGIPIHHVRFRIPGLGFAAALQSLMQETRPAVVHSHLNDLSGLVMLAASMAGVPNRIAHYHAQRTDRGWSRNGYVAMVRAFERRLTTTTIAVSSSVQRSYENFADDAVVLPPGIDLEPFRSPPSLTETRRRLGLDPEHFVVGHVGRFDAVKNHEWLLHVHRALIERRPGAVLVLAGDGPLRGAIERRADELGLTGSVHFLGARDDVPALLTAFDVFALPSYREGFAIALLEAQAAGLPCVVSTGVPDEAVLDRERVRRLSLTESPEVWTEALLTGGGLPRLTSDVACQRIEEAGFSVDRSAKSLLRLYG